MRLDELPGRRPLPPGLKARVSAELTRAVSEWASRNHAILERAQRRVALECIKEPQFLLDLRTAVREAMREMAILKDYADEDTASHLMGAILHMTHLDNEKIPEVQALIAKINKRRLAA